MVKPWNPSSSLISSPWNLTAWFPHKSMWKTEFIQEILEKCARNLTPILNGQSSFIQGGFRKKTFSSQLHHFSKKTFLQVTRNAESAMFQLPHQTAYHEDHKVHDTSPRDSSLAMTTPWRKTKRQARTKHGGSSGFGFSSFREDFFPGTKNGGLGPETANSWGSSFSWIWKYW